MSMVLNMYSRHSVGERGIFVGRAGRDVHVTYSGVAQAVVDDGTMTAVHVDGIVVL